MIERSELERRTQDLSRDARCIIELLRITAEKPRHLGVIRNVVSDILSEAEKAYAQIDQEVGNDNIHRSFAEPYLTPIKSSLQAARLRFKEVYGGNE